MPPEMTIDGVRRLAARRAADPWQWSGDRTIVVAGARRDSGASTLTALLALACAADGRRTLLIDANERAASQHVLFNVETTRSLIELQQPSVEIDQLLTSVADNCWLLPCVSPASHIARFGTAERRSVFRRTTQIYDHFDVVLIDAGSHLDGVVAAAGRGAWRFITVAGVDALSLASTYAVIKSIDTRWRQAPLEVLINRHDEMRGRTAFDQIRAGSTHFLDRDVGFSGAVPLDTALAGAANIAPELLLDQSTAGQVARRIAVRLLAELDDSALA